MLTVADFCDIPDLMQHLQNNYKFWVEEEENPTSNYDLSIKGPELNTDQNDSSDSQNKSIERSNSSNSENKGGHIDGDT